METAPWKPHDIVTKLVVMVTVFILAVFARGEWLLYVVYLFREHLREFLNVTDSQINGTLSTSGCVTSQLLQRFRLQDLQYYMAGAIGVSFLSFWGIGFAFDIYYYKNRKDRPKEWKCQPDRWLSPSIERHEFLLGSFNMLLGAIGSGFISCYMMNGGTNSLYLDVSKQGWVYLVLSIPALYMYNEAVSYYPHRFFHNPFLYKNVHKIHHKYGSPTLFSTTAMHPLEFLMYQVLLALPAFIVPLHVGVYLTILLYGYYYGMMDHSGISMDAVWPWQPPSLFHDDHHRYFHCNFGFNSLFFDKLHSTLRKKDRIYGEKVFGGRGKAATASNKRK